MEKTTRQKIISRVIMPLIFLIGLGILLYPKISNYLLVRSQTMVVEHYETKVADLPKEKKEELKKSTKDYNKSRVESTPSLGNTFSDEKVQKTKGNAVDDQGNQIFDVMQAMLGESLGTIEIPKIGLVSPIYKGTSEDILQKGIGWLEGSSLPSGGESTHTVLTGHRGLPTAELFTDLPEVKKGDQFVVTYLDEKLAYEVDQILTVKPEETEALRIEPGKDYTTLITCTPYMVNSHRLYVRGHRVPYSKEKLTAQTKDTNQQMTSYLIIGIACLIGLLLIIVIIKRRRRKKSVTKS
ncbi:class C sortase [Enterococcus florum]|nr:class C sortase [Enterococcus florum]